MSPKRGSKQGGTGVAFEKKRGGGEKGKKGGTPRLFQKPGPKKKKKGERVSEGGFRMDKGESLRASPCI